MQENMDVGRYRLRHQIWGLSYTQILDLFIMKISCNINYSSKNGILRGDVMSKTYEFLKECGYFYVLTINGDFPAGRPFGAVMEYDGKLFISTNDGNSVHKQLRDNGNIQIVAKKEATREWIRITGKAAECNDIKIKQKMLEECPVLSKHFSSAEAEHYLLFQVDVLNTEFH